MWPRPRRRRDVDAEGLITSTEALIAGRYVDYLEKRDEPVPMWAWMNLLAHASEDDLRRAAEHGPNPWRRSGMWCRARAYLAAEVLDEAGRRGSLRAVQAEVLIPLELELLTRPHRLPGTPGKWVTWVLSALQPRQTPSRP